jgi:RimJ/RimL family protein N-acetyltransferase
METDKAAARIPSETIELERVRLRKLEESDADAIFALYSDPEVGRYLARPALAERTQAEELIARVHAGYADGSSMQLGIERKDDGVLMGHCLLFHFHEFSRRAEIGYSLGRAYWSKGYMHEALMALVGLAFGPLNLNRLEADIDPRNLSSARTLERLGFAKEGLLRERWIVRGEASDTAFYGLLQSEWARRREA